MPVTLGWLESDAGLVRWEILINHYQPNRQKLIVNAYLESDRETILSDEAPDFDLAAEKLRTILFRFQPYCVLPEPALENI